VDFIFQLATLFLGFLAEYIGIIGLAGGGKVSEKLKI
jgi:hypothetical protein